MSSRFRKLSESELAELLRSEEPAARKSKSIPFRPATPEQIAAIRRDDAARARIDAIRGAPPPKIRFNDHGVWTTNPSRPEAQ